MQFNYVLSSFLLINSCFWVMILICSVSVFYFRNQFLVALLGLEFVVLTSFLAVSTYFAGSGYCISLSFYILILGACEASLGLSLLVVMSRFKGNDMLSSVSHVSC